MENKVEKFKDIKYCAKQIVDYIYKIDGFDRISSLFNDNKTTVKINTQNIDGISLGDNWLSSVFIKPNSTVYYPSENQAKIRVFDTKYNLKVKGKKIICKLTTEWVGNEVTSLDRNCNYLKALVTVVNEYYKDYLIIKEESNKYHLCPLEETTFGENKLDSRIVSKDFCFDEMSNVFDPTYSKRFITSLLAKPFVILTGNSGTGKTRIAKQFAEYLEVIDKNEEKNWLIVPVGADWTDNTRILGFYNPLGDNASGKYEKTAIIKLIERANENQNIPYFLILDEMNLSHVERYFSDFLSHMETIDNDFELDGYINNKLPYPKNLFVIGTVNIDETTYMFSPKVLDRANVIEFKPNKEDVLGIFDKDIKPEKINHAKPGVAESFLNLAEEIRECKNKMEAEEIEKITNVFAKVYDITEKKGFEFAYRTVKEIKQYVNAAHSLSKEWNEDDLDCVIDEQVLQKVLPKIHGNRKEISSMLDELEDLCKLYKLTLSGKKIEQMKGKLADVQYASFI